MARQSRSRPEPVRAEPGAVSPATPEDEHDGSHARPTPPIDPARVLVDHAADLADRHEVPAADVEAGLQRLAATFLGERADDAPALADMLDRPPLTLLADALVVMPGADAVRLIREGDLLDLDRRVRTTAWLASPDTPLFTRDELGLALTTLAAELHLDRDHLVKTGLPSRLYPGSPWLYHKFGRLYPTRQAASFVPYAERVSNPRSGVPPYTWMQIPHRDMSAGGEVRQSEYEQAAFLPGLSPADGLRVEADRARLLDLKIRLLRRVAQALAVGSVGSLWVDVLKVLSDTLTANAVEFYVGLDGRHPPTLDDPTTAADPRSPGGLTDLLELVGHVEQELTVGTLAVARAVLTDRTRTVLHDLTRGGTNRDAVPPERLYLALYGRPVRTGLDAAIDVVATRRDQAEAFWAAYRERINTALKQSFRVEVRVSLPAGYADRIAPHLPSFVSYAEERIAAGRWPADLPVGGCIFRRVGSSWLVVFDGQMAPGRDAVGLFYLRAMIERPGHEFPAGLLREMYALWRSAPDSPLRALAERAAAELAGRDNEDAALSTGRSDDVVADAPARRAYEKRVTELSQLIDQAEESGALARAAELRTELQQVETELATGRGLGRRLRRLSPQDKRDRDAVVKSINEAVAGFRDALSALYDHLTRALTLGATCRYHPEPPVNWQL